MLIKGRVTKHCGNYRSTTLLLKTYEILLKVLLTRLILFANEIIVGHQGGFRSD
jgi:hypothetical protein